jgi:cytochrome c peroxidase
MKTKVICILLISSMAVSFTIITTQPFMYPSYFPEPEFDFKGNPLIEDKIALGRALFFDPILSKDNTISCASCHSPYNAFAHTDHALSHGINDSIGNRNAPALMNLAWQRSFMWDGAIKHLNMQALAPITHAKEMGEDFKNVVYKLNANKTYKLLFAKAYRDTLVTGEKLLKALEQFQLTLVSANAKYDKVKQQKANFTAQEQKGYKIFLKNCNSCHTEPLFTNQAFANNGLQVNNVLNDVGRYSVTKNSKDSFRFKIPSLRNISYSYPYMHDGRFEKLSQVIEHYRTVDIAKTDIQKKIILSNNEKVDIVSFLLTLNDSSFVFNSSFQFPKQILLNKH